MTELALAIIDRSQIGEARRRALAMAAPLGYDETQSGVLALAVTELGTNLIKHAGGGTLLLRSLERGAALGIEILALDRGPGMANVAQSLRDGHSTAGSPGLGLGALSRMSHGLDIYSQVGKGTVLRCELWRGPAPAPKRESMTASAIRIPKPGETDCGDDWSLLADKGVHTLLVVDGLGHGPDAAHAAHEAKRALYQQPAAAAPAQILQAIHGALRSTRGAAASVAVLRPAQERVDFAGIGNVVGMVRHENKNRTLVSLNGILGHQVRKFQEFSAPFPTGAMFIMHSDGLATHWDLAHYPGLEGRHPGLIAGVLYRDHRRERDDATVVVLRGASGTP